MGKLAVWALHHPARERRGRIQEKSDRIVQGSPRADAEADALHSVGVFGGVHRHREVEQLEGQARVEGDLAVETAMNGLLQIQPPRTRSSPTPASALTRRAILQRKCACGGSHGAGG